MKSTKQFVRTWLYIITKSIAGHHNFNSARLPTETVGITTMHITRQTALV
ncbi:MAG: hypothetical protein ACFFFH_21625 [Candidatus Thorarchaeota archaeon]